MKGENKPSPLKTYASLQSLPCVAAWLNPFDVPLNYEKKSSELGEDRR